MKDGEEKRAHGSPSRKTQFFCDCFRQNELIVQYVFLKNAMEHSRYLCNCMQWICVNSQKLGELAEVAGTS